MIVKKDGIYSVQRDGSSYYRVFRKRTRIGSFLNLHDAIDYMVIKAKQSN
ncbi:hypothetical protein [Cytobacillus depressus]